MRYMTLIIHFEYSKQRKIFHENHLFHKFEMNKKRFNRKIVLYIKKVLILKNKCFQMYDTTKISTGLECMFYFN